MPPNTPTKRTYVRILPTEPPPSLWSSISKLRMDDEGSETSSLTGSDATTKPPHKQRHPTATTPTIQVQLPHISSPENEAKAYPQTHHTRLFHLLDTSSTGFKIVTSETHSHENGVKISLFNDYANTSSYYSMPLLESGSPASSPYDEPQNLSPYYRIPLLEEPVSTSYEDDRLEYLCSLDTVPLKQVSDAKGDDEDEEWGIKKKKGERLTPVPMPMPLRAMSPCQSLLLYLWGRGFSEEFIGTELGNLEEGFMVAVEPRRYVWGGRGEWVYVPPHWKLSDEKAREVVEVFMKEQEASEEGGEKEVWLKKRWRGRGMQKMARGLVEGYLMWRIKGVWEDLK